MQLDLRLKVAILPRLACQRPCDNLEWSSIQDRYPDPTHPFIIALRESFRDRHPAWLAVVKPKQPSDSIQSIYDPPWTVVMMHKLR